MHNSRSSTGESSGAEKLDFFFLLPSKTQGRLAEVLSIKKEKKGKEALLQIDANLMNFYSSASFSGKHSSDTSSSYLLQRHDANQFADTGHIGVAQPQQRE